MNATELRIGNYIRIITSIAEFQDQVKAIHENFIKINNGDGNFSIEHLRGVPIIENWLLKFGFEKTYAKNCYAIKSNPFSMTNFYVTIDEKEGKNIFAIGEELLGKESIFVLGDCEIKYLHQLQNLYFSLTGKELTTSQVYQN